jgi:hypothetical protein
MSVSSPILVPSTAQTHPEIWLPEEWEATTRSPAQRTLTIYGGIADQFRVWLAE